MPRRPRVFLEGGAYHVYCRVTRREPIFADREASARFVDIVREVKQQDRFTVFAWCVMPTHYHLALRAAEVPLWRSMRLIQGRFAQWHNKGRGTIGPVWQGRYKAKLLDDQRYLDQVIVYIHMNPVRAGLGLGYPMSGHRELVRRARSPLVDVDDALLSFGGEWKAAIAAYRSAMTSAMNGEWEGEDPIRLPWWQRLRRDEPLEPAEGRPFVDELGRSTGLERPPLEAKELIRRGAAMLAVELAAVTSASRDRQTVRARDMLCAVGGERYGLRARDIAAVLRRTPDQISRCVGRARWRRVTDPEFAEAMERLDRSLSRGLELE